MYTVRIFMKCTHVCAAQKAYKPFLSRWNCRPHPDMNIKVAAFTVSEKSSNNLFHVLYPWYHVPSKAQILDNITWRVRVWIRERFSFAFTDINMRSSKSRYCRETKCAYNYGPLRIELKFLTIVLT